MEGCKDKLVVLVTHQIQFLDKCPQIMLIKEGKPLVGSYKEISASGFNIKEILDSFNNALKKIKDEGISDEDDELIDEVDVADERTAVMVDEIKVSKLSRKLSVMSRKSKRNLLEKENRKEGEEEEEVKPEPKPEGEDLVVPEQKIEGSISWSVYSAIFKFSSLGVSALILFLLLNLSGTVCLIAPSYIISTWASLPLEEQQEQNIFPILLSAAIVGLIVFGLLRSIVFVVFSIQAATNMHNTMAEKVMRSPILFFDSNPIGRITTRFTKDQIISDMQIPVFAVFLSVILFRVAFIFVLIVIVNPYLLIVIFFGLIAIFMYTSLGIKPMIEC